MNNLQTQAYLPYRGPRDWTSDPDFMVVAINEKLVHLAEHGIKILAESGFNMVTSLVFPVEYSLVVADDARIGHVPCGPEHDCTDPEVKISGSNMQFGISFKSKSKEGWAELSFDQLATYMDKAWVESFGYVFAQLPGTGHNANDGMWVCADPVDSGEGFFVQCNTIAECVSEAANWLETTVDASMEGVVLRPKLNRLEGVVA